MPEVENVGGPEDENLAAPEAANSAQDEEIEVVAHSDDELPSCLGNICNQNSVA